MVQLVEIMEEAADPKAAATAQLKAAIQRILDSQGNLPIAAKFELDEHGVALKEPQPDHPKFEDCMAVVCGLNEINEAMQVLRPMEAFPQLSIITEQMWIDNLLEPIVRILERRVDASEDTLEKIEDHLAVAKIADSRRSTEYQELAARINDTAMSCVENLCRMGPRQTLAVFSSIQKLYVTHDEPSDFTLSHSQMDLMDKTLLNVLGRLANDQKLTPENAEDLLNLSCIIDDEALNKEERSRLSSLKSQFVQRLPEAGAAIAMMVPQESLQLPLDFHHT
jgi:hypothetical protein